LDVGGCIEHNKESRYCDRYSSKQRVEISRARRAIESVETSGRKASEWGKIHFKII
jgi:hypothetical protein